MALEVLESLKSDEKCIFCRHNEIDELRYGKMYKYENIITHYFCMLFSSNMEQNGEDEEGILGFLPKDIKKEVFRGNRLNCVYCHHPGATIGCTVKTCKKKFHYPCGIQQGSLHLFYGQFRSYCFAHRRSQNVPQSAVNLTEKSVCVMCQDEIVAKPLPANVWAPCCKTAWLHRTCVQRMAINAGYFFKCPNCNNKEMFRKEMLECGIYIPDQDAVWELEPNAFNDLTERYNSCDAENCLCPKGKNFSEQGDDWEIILCSFCGSQGIHNKCWENLQDPREQWICALCSPIAKTETCSSIMPLEEPGPSRLPQKQPQSPRRSQNLRKETSCRSQKYNRKRTLSPTSEETECTPSKVRPDIQNPENQSDTMRLLGNSGEQIEVVRLENTEVSAVEIGGVQVDLSIVQIDSDDDEEVKPPGDDIENQLTKLGIATTQKTRNRRIASDIAPSIIIDLLDSDDEDQNSDKARILESSKNGSDNSEDDDDDVIFVGCDPPKPNTSKEDNSSALIRIVNNNNVLITTPTNVRRNLETITSNGSITITSASVNPAQASFHVLPRNRANNDSDRNFVWQTVPLHKSHSNTYQQPQIISTISLENDTSANNIFYMSQDRSTEKNSNFLDQRQLPTKSSEPNSWISEPCEIIDLD